MVCRPVRKSTKYDLAYFNIGFRSDNAVETLKRIKDAQNYQTISVESLHQLISDCGIILDGTEGIMKNPEKYDLYTTLLLKDREDKTPSEIEDEIKQTRLTLESIMANKKPSTESLDIAIGFFEYLGTRTAKLSDIPAPEYDTSPSL